MSGSLVHVLPLTRLDALRDAVCLTPASAPARHALGTALLDRGEIVEAIECQREAVALAPGEVRYRIGLGMALTRASAFEEAADSFRRAMAIDPWSIQALLALARVCTMRLGRHAEARAACLRCLETNPGEQTAYELLCHASLDGLTLAGADRRVRYELPKECDAEPIAFAIGHAGVDAGRYEEAHAYLDRCVQAGGADPAARALLARVTHACGDGQAAATHFAYVSDCLDNQVACDEYVRYLWRRGRYDEVKQALQAPRATSVAGRALLLGNSMLNGFGDEIQWAGVAPLLHAMGARVMIECRTTVHRLLATMTDIDGVVIRHDAYPAQYERHTIFRLLASIDWRWDRVGRQVPYLHIPSGLAREWRAKVERAGRGVHIGVEWRATDAAARDGYTRRTMPASALALLLTIPGVTWHSLHVGDAGRRELASCDPHLPFAPLSAEIDDFLDTAAAVNAVDAVLTVDTAIAHVAGALGKPAFLILPAYPEWRWGDDDTPAPWYPSIQRCRQQAPGNWASAIEALEPRLAAFVRARIESSCHRHSPS